MLKACFRNITCQLPTKICQINKHSYGKHPWFATISFFTCTYVFTFLHILHQRIWKTRVSCFRHRSNKTSWSHWILSELFRQFPECSGSGPGLGWECTQRVLRNTFASTAGGTSIIKSGIFNCYFWPKWLSSLLLINRVIIIKYFCLNSQNYWVYLLCSKQAYRRVKIVDYATSLISPNKIQLLSFTILPVWCRAKPGKLESTDCWFFSYFVCFVYDKECEVSLSIYHIRFISKTSWGKISFL